jgi:hypothetical protein
LRVEAPEPGKPGAVVLAAADCTAATAGTRREIPYTADYRFWKETGRR